MISGPDKTKTGGRVAFGIMMLIGFVTLSALGWVPLGPQPLKETQTNDNAPVVDSEDKEKENLKEYLCHLRDTCSTYYLAREDCATAGNLSTCIRIKLAQNNWQYEQQTVACPDEGVSLLKSANAPSWIECAVRTYIPRDFRHKSP
jgi:hypothetical protein